MTAFQEYVLNELAKNCNFDNLCEGNCYEKIVEPLQQNKEFDASKFSYAYGATKIVLMFSGEDYVIKIPFSCKYEADDEEEGCPFTEAPLDADWDYCLAETRVYKEAEKQGLGTFFAKTEFLGYAGDYPVYIQQRAVIFEDLQDSDSIKRHSTKEIQRARSQCEENSCWCFDRDWMADCNQAFGETIVNTLLQFINDQGLDDFHSGNIGYINNVPVIVDYSDYRE